MEDLFNEAIPHTSALVRRACWFLQDADRRDIVQEVLLAYWCLLRRHGQPQDSVRWLSAVVLRRRARWYRDHGARWRRLFEELPVGTRVDEVEDSRAPAPEARSDGYSAWRTLLDDLDSHLTMQEMKDVLDMVAGEACGAIARQEGVSKDRIVRRRKKTREKLRRLLE